MIAKSFHNDMKIAIWSSMLWSVHIKIELSVYLRNKDIFYFDFLVNYS